jgi:hypothetical protein
MSLRSILVTPSLAAAVSGCPSAGSDTAAAEQRDTVLAAPSGATATEFARRADSLGALVPEREAEAAIAHGDLRFVGVCGYVCYPAGPDRRGHE